MHGDAGQGASALGLAGDQLRCLLLLPLAYVAAASRRRDLALLDRLIESSAAAAKLDAAAAARVRGWLRQPPTESEFEQGLQQLRHSSQCQDGPFTVRDSIEAMLWACSAAQLDRERIGRRYTPVSSSARHAVAELEALLGIQVGELWSDVLDELGEELPRSKNVVAPRFQSSPESRHGRQAAAPDSAPSSTSRAGG